MDDVRFPASRSTPLQVGDRAPDFNLRQTFDQSVARLPEKPIVVAFYVFDFGDF